MHGRAHAVSVILADVNRWQIPKLGHIPGLEELALRGRAIAVQCESHAACTVVLMGQGHTSADWYLIRKYSEFKN